MLDFSLIDTNSIFICPSDKKEYLIREYSNNYPHLHLKFITKNEVIKGLNFTYDLNALYYLHSKYNYNYSIAKEILDNLINLKPIDEKCNELLKLFNELKEHNLLKFNELYKQLFTNKKVYIYGYSKHDLFLTSTLDKINVNYEFIKENNNNYSHCVYKFNSIEEEVLFTFNSIASLIEKGISQNKIYLYSYNQDYDWIIKKYSYNYGFNLEEKENTMLIDTPLYKRYRNLLNDNDYLTAFESLKETISLKEEPALKKLASLLVDLSDLNLENNELLELLDYLASNKVVNKIKYSEYIKLCSSDTTINDDEYVFILGFSIDSFPIIHQDIDYLSDYQKQLLKLNTSVINNEIEKEKLINFLNKTKNLTITYKTKLGKIEYYPSLLIEELNLTIKDGDIDNIRYSYNTSKYEVGKYLDEYIRYGSNNKYLHTYSQEEIGYKSFDHSFKNISDFKLPPLKLSYSRINQYNHCHFQYFVEKLLKINDFENNFYLKLGNLFHYILEKSINEEINNDTFNDYLKESFTSNKELFLLNNLLNQIFEVIDKNKKFNTHTCFKDIKPEYELYYQIDENAQLYGKIDKIMFDQTMKNLVLIDYKTGDFKYRKAANAYGFDLQLPIYSLLLSDNYPKYNIAGLYIQNILVDPNDDRKKSKRKNLEKKYYLNGLTLFNDNIVKRLDMSLATLDEEGNPINSSKYIMGVKLKKDGTLAKGQKLVNEEEIKEMIEQTKEQLLKIVEQLRNGDFKISPTVYKNDTLPCQNCSYRDICFTTSDDVVRIKDEVEELDEI